MEEEENAEDPEFYMGLESHFGANNYHPVPVVINKAKGVWVWDVRGKKYLDCLAAYSAVNQGHLHPKIVKAAKEQLKRVSLTSRAFYNDKMAPFLKKLCQFTGMEMALPMNSGAEAVETGIKLARRWGYFKKKIPENQAEIIVAENNFHGRTTTIVSFSTSEISTKGFGPETPGFITIPFNDPKALKNAITKNTVAFLVEPIQGEAGVIVPNEGYLKEVQKICALNDVLLILDEIQTGFGRTGKNFAFQHENAKPDVLLVGKALSGGISPVSAALSSRDIMSVFTPGSHGSTFGGNPFACEVGVAAIEVVEEEHLADRAAKLGAYFLNELKILEKKSKIVREVRGKGLLIAVEFEDTINDCRFVVQALMKKGILVKETHGNIVRFAPPLVITKKELRWAAKVVVETILSFNTGQD